MTAEQIFYTIACGLLGGLAGLLGILLAKAMNNIGGSHAAFKKLEEKQDDHHEPRS